MFNFLGKTAIVIIISLSFLAFPGNFSQIAKKKETPAIQQQEFQVITGIIKKGETLFDIFKRHHLYITELYKIREASANIHKLREIYPGRQFKIICDNNEQISSFLYWIDDDCYLNVNRTDQGYCAEKIPIVYEKRTLNIGSSIKDNLISSLGEGTENLLLALQLSDIFAWDIVFKSTNRRSWPHGITNRKRVAFSLYTCNTLFIHARRAYQLFHKGRDT